MKDIGHSQVKDAHKQKGHSPVAPVGHLKVFDHAHKPKQQNEHDRDQAGSQENQGQYPPLAVYSEIGAVIDVKEHGVKHQSGHDQGLENSRNNMGQ